MFRTVLSKQLSPVSSTLGKHKDLSPTQGSSQVPLLREEQLCSPSGCSRLHLPEGKEESEQDKDRQQGPMQSLTGGSEGTE